MIRNKPPKDLAYRTDYEKGWRYSGSSNPSLDNTGDKSDAWEDGYLDRAAGREKWHYYYCRLAGPAGGCSEHWY